MENKITLNQAINGKKSSTLSLVRFLAALLVIVSHSFLLSQGRDSIDFLAVFSKGSMGLGGVAVAVFLLSSGILVSKSLERSKNGRAYFIARIKRIFPPLVLVILLTVFVLGPIMSKLSIFEYFTSVETYKYLLNVLLVPIHNLPGVFENNIYMATVNGALWMLPVEFVCYIGLFIIYKLRLLNKRGILMLAPFVFILFLLIYYSHFSIFMFAKPFAHPFFLFYVGVVLYVFSEDVVLRNSYAWIALFLTVFFFWLGFAEIGIVFLFPYAFIVAVFNEKQCSTKLATLGKYSYGIYLVGFPTQQVLVSINGGSMNIYVNMMLSILIAAALSRIVYLISEKPFY